MITPKEFWTWVAHYDLQADEREESDEDALMEPGEWLEEKRSEFFTDGQAHG